MSHFGETEILALAASWRTRARTFRREASESEDPRSVARLAAMASTLDFAARELCFEAEVDPNSVPLPANPEVERERRAAEEYLGGAPKSPRS